MAKTIAFFGATGGCANAALVRAVNAGYTCTALARAPQKLQDMLSKANVPSTTMQQHLRIVQGNVRDISAVKDVLEGADVIVSGIGMDMLAKDKDPTICQAAAKNILDALAEAKPAKRPFFATISTTGISNGDRDVPIALVPLYHFILKEPHADKRIMEQYIASEAAKGANSTLAGYTLIRPSLLMGTTEHEPAKIRVGDETKPEVGYSISRLDVGRWIFNELVAGDASVWNGRKPSLTL